MVKVAERPTQDKALTLAKNTQEQYRFSLEHYHGRDYADLRIYYLDDDSGEYRPTRKGLTIAPDNWPQFMAALRQLEAQLERRGLLEEGAV